MTSRILMSVIAIATMSANRDLAAQRTYIDLRPIQAIGRFDAGPRLFIMLAAREGMPGHAFVLWGMEDPTSQQSKIEAFGLYPTVGPGGVMKAGMGPVPGALMDEIIKRQETGCCSWSNPDVLAVFRVDQQTWDRSKQVKAQFAGKTNWTVLEQDCVTFLMEVGSAIQLAMPQRRVGVNASPAAYVRSVLDALGNDDGIEMTDGGSVRVWRNREGYTVDGDRAASVPNSAREGWVLPLGNAANGSRGQMIIRESSKGSPIRTTIAYANGDEWTQLQSSAGGHLGAQYRYRDGTTVDPIYRDQDQAPPLGFSGGVFQGDWRRGMPNGRGKYTGPNGAYDGNWVDGRPHGAGTASLPGGVRYSGQWRDGVMSGNGALVFPDGQVFNGTFDRGWPVSGQFAGRDGRGGGRLDTDRPGGERRAGEREGSTRDDMTGTVREIGPDGRTVREREIRGMEFPSRDR